MNREPSSEHPSEEPAVAVAATPSAATPTAATPLAATPLAATPSAATDGLVIELQRRILVGDYPPGTRLRQELLADEFGVSRMPVRAALLVLHSKGLLETIPRRGAFVRGPSPHDIREAYVVRAELEGLAAELAAQQIPDDDLRALRTAADLFRSCVEEFVCGTSRSSLPASEPLWSAANDQFHEGILAASGNDRLRKTVLQLHSSFPRNLTWSAISQSSSLLRHNVGEHDAILAAIEAGDPVAARQAARAHVRRSGELIASRHETWRSTGS
jgi:DNA-binding GntR family transcriptional regulator